MLDKYGYILDYFRGAWLKRRSFYIASWFICLVGWSVVALLPNQYESSARVYVDTDSILKPLLKGLTVEVDTDAKIQLMIRTLLSRENLEKIIRMTDLDINADTPEKYEDLIKDLGDDFFIKKERAGNIFNLSIKDKDPVVAKNIVESALNVFIENTILDNRNDSDSAKKFIDEQIEHYEQKLVVSEENLAKFKQTNAELLPNLTGGYYSRLEAEKKNFEQAELNFRVLEQRISKDVIDLSVHSEDMEFESIHDQRLIELNIQLDRASMKYRDLHPDMIEINRLITYVKELRNKDIEEKRRVFRENPQLANAGIKSTNDNAGIIKEMQIQMHALSGELKSEKIKRDNYARKIKDLESKINTIPVIEAELKVLTRGYENNKIKYEDFLSRRSSAELSSEVDVNSDDIEFKIINPPLVPIKPVGPKHILLTLGVLIAGVGTGGALAFLLSQINPVATSNSSVFKSTKFPVLGTVEASSALGLNKEKTKAIRNFIVSNILLLGIMSCFIVYFLFPSLVMKVIGFVEGLL